MKKTVLVPSVALAVLCWAAPGFAQPDDNEEQPDKYDDKVSTAAARGPILVVASRSEDTPINSVNSAYSRLTPEMIEQRQTRDIADVFRDVPGVAVSSVAGQTQIRLRGSEANHVLVLVDGIEVSDPFAGEFDIGTLQAEIGSRVEVLRGPQSALYGSDAIGGVVAYESSTHDGFEARVEAGSNDTINASAHLGLRNDTALLALNATLVSTDGQPNARDGVRDIGRDSYTLSGRALVDPAPNVQLRAAGRFIHAQGDFNDQDFDSTSPTFGLVIDSPGTRFENDAIYALAGARVDFLDGRWLHDVSAQLADIDRNSFASFGRTNGNEGNRLKLSYVSALSFSNAHHLTFAADWERERFRNDDPFGVGFSERRQIENVGLVGEYRFAGERFDFDAALRHDINDRFADETTFRFGAGYRLSDNTRIRASAGTGIKNPGFFELFGFFDGRFIGNEDLTPEQSTSWEIGLDHTLPNGKARFSLTYFDSELEDEIFTSFPAPDFVATPANRNSDSQQSGVEVSARAFLGGGFTIDAAYSFLNAKEDGVEEVRRPDNIASLVVNWATRDDRLSANLAMRYNGDAEDLAFIDPSFIPLRVTLDDYTLVNFNIAYQVNPSAQLFARAENLLNEEYEQVFSFTNPGRSVLAGVRISI